MSIDELVTKMKTDGVGALSDKDIESADFTMSEPWGKLLGGTLPTLKLIGTVVDVAAKTFIKECRDICKKAQTEHDLYTRVFTFVASNGCEDPSVIASKFDIPEEQAVSLLQQMRENGDIACEDNNDSEEESDKNDLDDENCDTDSDDDFDDISKIPEKIIEGLCFIGDVIQDTSEKICDVLDDSFDRVIEHDFDE